MSQLRQDPITRDWVIINEHRAARPQDAGAAAPGRCPFCPGNEGQTPEEIDRIDRPGGGWAVRVVPNRYPALDAAAAPVKAGTAPNGARTLPGFGFHEVIIESTEHDAVLGGMPRDQVRLVLEMYVRRFRALAASDARVRQVVLFRNQGVRAGTSLAHPHAQIVATPVVSPEVRRRVEDEIAYYDATGSCGLCDICAAERRAGERVVHESAHFVTFAPYASRVSYQLQVAPRVHRALFADIDAAALDDLAAHLCHVLGALELLLDRPHYNLVVMTPPLDQVHALANHWFIDLLPRLATPAGFEMGSRIVINTKPPEQAARELRAHGHAPRA